MTETALQSDTSWRPDLRAPIVMALAGLLILQILLAFGLGAGRGQALAPSAADTPLFGFTPEQAQGLRIESGDGTATVSLVRRNDAWVIADLADLPVQSAKVDRFLDDLVALKRPLPVATSEEARKRFRVADDGFERRLVVEGEQGPIASLLVGDSPGFRRVFARTPEDPGVYDMRLAASDISARRDDWIETGLLRLEGEQIVRVAADDWTLSKGKDGLWALADTDKSPDQEAVAALILRLANLGYRGVFGIEDDPAYNQAAPELVLDIGLADGGTRSYRISKVKDSDDYALKDSARPWYFKLSALDLGELLDTDAAGLVAAEEAASETTETTAETGAPSETPDATAKPVEPSVPAHETASPEAPPGPAPGGERGP